MKDSFSQTLNQLCSAARLAGIDNTVTTILTKPQREAISWLPLMTDKGLKMVRAYRVQYNNALGPYKGGIRYHHEVDINEVRMLALLMTIKNALFKLPLGGGKGGIVINPKTLTKKELKQLSQLYVQSLYPMFGPDKDIPAPDVYTNEQIIDWMSNEFNKLSGKLTPTAFTGKSLKNKGIQGREEATGLGGFYTLLELTKKLKKRPRETTIAIQGFGNVGYHFAIAVYKAGYKIIAVSDSKGGILDKRKRGMNPRHIKQDKLKKGLIGGCYCIGSVCDCFNYQAISNKKLLELPVDILVPAALGGSINKGNVLHIKARAILEMANGAINYDAYSKLEKKKITVVPDILANAGGVIVSYFEYQQNLKNEKWTKTKVFSLLEKRIKDTLADIWSLHQKKRCTLRTAAWILALQILAPKIKQR